MRWLGGGELLLEQNLGQRSKGLRQPVQPAAERLTQKPSEKSYST